MKSSGAQSLQIGSSQHLADPARFDSLNRVRKLLGISGLACFLLAVPLLLVDVPISEWAGQAGLPGELRTLIRLSEAFSHGLGALLILLAVGWIVRWTRRDWIVSLGMVYLPGLVVNIGKLMVVRRRPGSLLNEYPEFGYQTFVGFRPFVSGEELAVFDRAFQSFPSGHTATAFGLAICLATFFPRGAGFFYFFAFLAAMQRVDSLAHFPSDTAVGAGIAFLVTAALLKLRWVQSAIMSSRTATRYSVQAESADTGQDSLEEAFGFKDDLQARESEVA